MRGAVVVLGLLFASPLSAQPRSGADSVLWKAAANRSLVRITADQARMVGRVTGLSPAEASLATEAGPRTIRLGAVDTIWVPGRAWGAGAIAGGIIGGLTLGTFVSVVASGLCEVRCENVGLRGALVGGAIGAAGGALIGAGIGALFPRWKRRFAR